VLTNAERSARRREQVAPFLEPDDVLLGSFIMERADVAAREAAGAAVGLIAQAGGLVVALLAVAARKTARRPSEPRWLTVAVLEDGVVLLRNDARNRPKAVVERLPGRDALGQVVGPMQGQITLRDRVYDVPLICVDEARRLLGSG
jgi:hypothetical protein